MTRSQFTFSYFHNPFSCKWTVVLWRLVSPQIPPNRWQKQFCFHFLLFILQDTFLVVCDWTKCISLLLAFDHQIIVIWYSSFMVHFLFHVTWSDGNKELVFAFLFDLMFYWQGPHCIARKHIWINILISKQYINTIKNLARIW